MKRNVKGRAGDRWGDGGMGGNLLLIPHKSRKIETDQHSNNQYKIQRGGKPEYVKGDGWRRHDAMARWVHGGSMSSQETHVSLFSRPRITISEVPAQEP